MKKFQEIFEYIPDVCKFMLYSFPSGSSGKESTCNARDAGDLNLIPGSGGYPLRRKWQPTPVFLPGKSRGQKSLVGYCS